MLKNQFPIGKLNKTFLVLCCFEWLKTIILISRGPEVSGQSASLRIAAKPSRSLREIHYGN